MKLNKYYKIMTFILNKRTLIRLQQYNDGNVWKIPNIDKFATYGHLSLIRYYNCYHNVICTIDAMELASRNGYLNIVKWLHHNRNEGCTYGAMDMASSYGHLDIVKFLHNNRDEGCTKDAMAS